MKVSLLHSRFTRRERFARWAELDVSEVPGCYALANVYDEVLYIGQSLNLRRRFLQHLDDRTKTGPTSNGLAHWFYFLEVRASDLKRAEDALLSQYKFHTTQLPPLNRAGP